MIASVIDAGISKGDIEPYEKDGSLNENDISDRETSARFRAVWVSTVYNLDYPRAPTNDSGALKRYAEEILDSAKACGFNAIVLQVRPAADALYPSEYFPWSRFLTGVQGTPPSDGFDPLKFWIDEAHKREMALHAWINPYRVTKNDPAAEETGMDPLSDTHPARKDPTLVVRYTDGNLYFDPGIPKVRELIVNSIGELVQNYDVDGVHFDDYFYPGRDFDDEETYAKYGAGHQDIGDFRRECVTSLIKDVSALIKEIDDSISFGISPFGIWANAANIKEGSGTNGVESYFDHYADTLSWVKSGYIDYIAPQLYWEIGNKDADYKTLLSWWADAVSGTNVKLYIGIAAYRAGDDDKESAWYGVDEIYRQLSLNMKNPRVSGEIFFRYSFFRDIPALRSALTAQCASFGDSPSRFFIETPPCDISTDRASLYISGECDPKLSLYLNGEKVEDVSGNGRFSVPVKLESGTNIFAFVQGGQIVSRTIKMDPNASGDADPPLRMPDT